MGGEPLVSIVIVNWNGKNLLATCLNSIKKTTYSNYKVIVVDNGSSDGSPKYVREEFPWAHLIALRRNYGFSIGNNKGTIYALKEYDPQYVLLMNNDVQIIQKNWLNKMVEAAENDGTMGVAGCKFVYPDGSAQNIGTRIDFKGPYWIDPNLKNLPEIFEVDSILGACFLIKRTVIDTIGLLDEGFSPFLYEETDYCVRARRAGYRSCTISTVTVVHARSVSTHRIDSYYAIFVERKNAIRFMLLNFPLAWIMLRLPRELAIVFSIMGRNKDKKGVFPFKLRRGKELIYRTGTNINAWIINLRNLREIIAKRRNRKQKFVPADSQN